MHYLLIRYEVSTTLFDFVLAMAQHGVRGLDTGCCCYLASYRQSSLRIPLSGRAHCRSRSLPESRLRSNYAALPPVCGRGFFASCSALRARALLSTSRYVPLCSSSFQALMPIHGAVACSRYCKDFAQAGLLDGQAAIIPPPHHDGAAPPPCGVSGCLPHVSQSSRASWGFETRRARGERGTLTMLAGR